ncbi:hypothetical protein IIA79_08645 [bacterium]|nr:hypothetical protein [bacterium]
MKRHEFEHLCQLTRLELGEDEFAEFERKFSRLLGFVEMVQEYEADSSEAPLALVEKVELREDRAVRCDWPEEFAHDYRVPRIIAFDGENDA